MEFVKFPMAFSTDASFSIPIMSLFYFKASSRLDFFNTMGKNLTINIMSKMSLETNFYICYSLTKYPGYDRNLINIRLKYGDIFIKMFNIKC
jgi:hypothetical protein